MTTILNITAGTSAQQLQASIDSASPGTIFQLAAGTYNFDQTIFVRDDSVQIVGAGAGLTVIHVDASIADQPVFQFGHTLHKPVILDKTYLSTSASMGETAITVVDGHGLATGDYIYITQDNTDDFLDSIGDTSWRKTKDLRTILVQVTSVSGNTIGIDSPLTFDFDPAITEVQHREIIENVGLSGVTLVGPYGTADAGDFSNTVSSGKGQTMVLFAGTANATASDIEIIDGISHGITVADSREFALSGFHMDGSSNKGAGGNGYALWIRDVYDSSFTDLTIADVRHAVIFASYTSASGNYVQVTSTNRDINFHGGLDQFNIVEVDAMVRTSAEQAYLSTAVSYNVGSSWGAPTDPTTNLVAFRYLVASNKDESVISHDDGSTIYTVDGNDTITTGLGDDWVDGGNGKDLIFASVGIDFIAGGGGTDTVVFDGDSSDYQVTWLNNGAEIVSSNGVTILESVEFIIFKDVTIDTNSGSADPTTTPPPVAPPPTPIPLALADLNIVAAWLDDPILVAGEDTKIRLHVQNDGDVDVRAYSNFYWSADAILDSGDILIDADSHGTLSAGEIDSNERERLDGEVLAGLGDGYIFAVIDPADMVLESNEANNVSHALFIDII